MPWLLSAFPVNHPLSWNALLLFGTMLIVGMIGAQIVAKIPWIPRITGYLLIGFALGSGGLNLISADVFEIMHVFADIAIALIVYQLGRYVDLTWLARERWLLLTIIGTSLLSFFLVWWVLEWAGMRRPTAMLTGIFAIGTSPAILIAVMRDAKAEGHITRRLAAMCALNNFIALLAAYALLPLLASEDPQRINLLILHAAYSLGGAFLLAYCSYRLMMPLARWLGRQRQQQFVLVIGIITLTLGAAHALQLPVLLTMLAFAILSRNLDQRYDLMDLEFGIVSELFIVLLFVTLGTTMHLPDEPLIFASVALLVLARCMAIGTGIFALASPARLSWRQAALLTIGSLPMTESELGIVQISTVFPHTVTELQPLLAGTLMTLEMFGPIATKFALVQSGESAHS